MRNTTVYGNTFDRAIHLHFACGYITAHGRGEKEVRVMSETNAERFNQIKILFETPGEIYYGEISSEGAVSQDVTDASDDFKWLINRVQELENDLEAAGRALGESANELVKVNDKYQRLHESYKELVIQENAMQGHWRLAWKNMARYKKCVDDITDAMNTERRSNEKTREIREILDSMK